MAAYWNRKRQICVSSSDARGYFVDPNSWVDDWNFGRGGLHINRRGARRLGELYSRVCGMGGGTEEMRSERQSLAVGTSRKGTYEETGMKTIQEI